MFDYDNVAAKVNHHHNEYIKAIANLAATIYEEEIYHFLKHWKVEVRIADVSGRHEWYLYFPHCHEPIDSLMETYDSLPADLNGYVKYLWVDQISPILRIEIDGGSYFDIGDYVFRYHLDKLSENS